MAPSAPTELTPEQLARGRVTHERLNRWSETVLLHALERGEPVRYVVARVGTDGLKFLMDPELAHFTNVPSHVLRFDTKPEATSAMARGMDVTRAAYGPKAAAIYWKGQRVVPIYNTPESPLSDLP